MPPDSKETFRRGHTEQGRGVSVKLTDHDPSETKTRAIETKEKRDPKIQEPPRVALNDTEGRENLVNSPLKQQSWESELETLREEDTEASWLDAGEYRSGPLRSANGDGASQHPNRKMIQPRRISKEKRNESLTNTVDDRAIRTNGKISSNDEMLSRGSVSNSNGVVHDTGLVAAQIEKGRCPQELNTFRLFKPMHGPKSARGDDNWRSSLPSPIKMFPTRDGGNQAGNGSPRSPIRRPRSTSLPSAISSSLEGPQEDHNPTLPIYKKISWDATAQGIPVNNSKGKARARAPTASGAPSIKVTGPSRPTVSSTSVSKALKTDQTHQGPNSPPSQSSPKKSSKAKRVESSHLPRNFGSAMARPRSIEQAKATHAQRSAAFAAAQRKSSATAFEAGQETHAVDITPPKHFSLHAVDLEKDLNDFRNCGLPLEEIRFTVDTYISDVRFAIKQLEVAAGDPERREEMNELIKRRGSLPKMDREEFRLAMDAYIACLKVHIENVKFAAGFTSLEVEVGEKINNPSEGLGKEKPTSSESLLERLTDIHLTATTSPSHITSESETLLLGGIASEADKVSESDTAFEPDVALEGDAASETDRTPQGVDVPPPSPLSLGILNLEKDLNDYKDDTRPTQEIYLAAQSDTADVNSAVDCVEAVESGPGSPPESIPSTEAPRTGGLPRKPRKSLADRAYQFAQNFRLNPFSQSRPEPPSENEDPEHEEPQRPLRRPERPKTHPSLSSKATYLNDNPIDQAHELAVEILLLRAYMLWRLHDWEKMISKIAIAGFYADKLTYEPLTARCMFYLGVAEYEMGRKSTEEVIGIFEKARRCMGHYPEGELIDQWVEKAEIRLANEAWGGEAAAMVGAFMDRQEGPFPDF